MNRSDTPRPEPAGTDDLEQALRQTLAWQVAMARPVTADLAGQVIRRAERHHRRRTVAGLALTAVATVTVSAGLVQLNAGRAPDTGPTVVVGDPSGPPATNATWPSPATLDGPVFAGLAVIIGSSLVIDGRGTALDVGPVERGMPAGPGWLFIGVPGPAGRTVWAVNATGTSRVLLAGADAVAADPTGSRLAWREGTELAVATVDGGRLLPGPHTTVPESVTPVGFVGDDVLVRLHPTRPGFALWRTDGRRLTPTTGRSVLDVYGRLPDGPLVARITGGTSARTCLALLDPARDLAVTRTSCGLPSLADGPGSVSPDGRWLLVNRHTGTRPADGTALLVDLRQTFDARPLAQPVGPATTGPAAWVDDEVAYPATDGTVVRLRPDQALVPAASAAVPMSADQPPVLVARATL